MALLVQPRNSKEAKTGPDASIWQEAMKKELAAMATNQAWTVVHSAPAGAVIIGTKWVHAVKRSIDGTCLAKSRLVALGNSQPDGNGEDVSSPVVSHDSLRIILSIAATEDLDIEHFDVSAAFLIPELKDEVYLRPPSELLLPTNQRHFLRLRKAIYGLRQSGKLWNDSVVRLLSSNGLNSCASDPCIFIGSPDGQRTLVALWVDDFVVASTKRGCDNFNNLLRTAYPIKRLGPLTLYLGIEITLDRSSRTITLKQTARTRDILEEYNLLDGPRASTPDITKHLLMAADDLTPGQRSAMAAIPYSRMVGQLQYLAITTRPDISYAAVFVKRKSSNPGPDHLDAVYRIMHYLNSTLEMGLTLGGIQDSIVLEAWADADFAGCPTTTRSTSGWLLYLGKEGPVVWGSKRQKVAASSTTESEINALLTCVESVLAKRSLLDELGYQQLMPTAIHQDNKSLIAMGDKATPGKNTRHMATRQAVIRDNKENGCISIAETSSVDMIADVLTKALPPISFHPHVRNLGLTQG